MSKPRAREAGLPFPGTPGPGNAITDIPGVEVGVATLVREEGPVRTGVTAILPRGADPEPCPVWAGIHALNGNGEMTGSHWIADAGNFYGPVVLTNTHSVGIAHHATVRWMIDTYGPALEGAHFWALPVVAETYDGVLNDIDGQHVTEADVRAALDGARPGPVPEGNVGGGTGMIAYEFKGGTGTASRRVGAHIVGALVQANHGRRADFTVLGVPVGARLPGEPLFERETGSIIVVLATDAPMMPHQLQRLARRAGLGIARHGTPGGNNSGDIFLALSTANRIRRSDFRAGEHGFRYLADEEFDPYYMAAVESVEEAVLNAMAAAEDMPTLKPPGRVCRALDMTALRAAWTQGRAG